MRRVVVTGMGIVSSIGNNTQEVLASLREAKSGISRADKYAELGFKCQVHGAPDDRLGAHGPAQAQALHERGRRLELDRHGSGDPRRGPRSGRCRQRAHRHHHGLGRPLDARHRRSRRDDRQIRRPQEDRSVRSAQGHVLGPLGVLWRRRSRSRAPTIRSRRPARRRAHCIGNAAELIQWGKQDVMFAGGCEELDWTLSNLFDAMGAMSSQVQRHAADGQPRLRQKPRRLRDRGRRRRTRARRTRARQGARRQDLRRGRRLRRNVGRLRHGGPVGRRRGALHEAGAQGFRRQGRAARSTTSTRTAPARRSATPRKSTRSAKCSASRRRRPSPRPNR